MIEGETGDVVASDGQDRKTGEEGVDGGSEDGGSKEEPCILE